MNFGALTMPLGELEPMVRDMLAPSIARDPVEDIDDVLDEVDSGNAQVWLITDEDQIKGVVVTQIYVGRKGKQLFIRHCSGNGIDSWLHFLDVIEQWARDEGCQTMELIGRDGFERLLGWKKQAVVLRKEL